jgi:type II secretory pathway component GspD/PulD (secretin)
MNHHPLQRWTLVFFSVCLMAAAAWGQAPQRGLEIITLKHRTADEVIPALQPLLETGGALSGDNFTLFVRTSPANLVQLRQALEQLDRRPSQYLISVRNSTRQEIEREELAAAAAIGTNGARATVRATDANARQQGTNISSVMVLEGNEAFIATGAGQPARGGGSFGRQNSGITVTPRRLSDQQVMLQIQQQSRERSATSGRIESQSLSTQVTGKLGQWLELGGLSGSSSTTQRGILSGSYATSSDERSVWVKIELSP